MRIKRVDELRRLIETRGSATMNDLQKETGLSISTIRRYLKELERSGFSRKVYGGAVAVESGRSPFGSFDLRSRSHTGTKEQIGAAAARFVRNQDVIMLDSGTTAYHLARHLDRRLTLSIVTNNVPVIHALTGNVSFRIITVGGEYSHDTQCTYGFETVRQLGDLRATKAFIGATGLHPSPDGITNDPIIEAETKRTLMRQADQVFLIVDSSKFDVLAPGGFASYSEIDFLITDRLPQGALLEILREHAVKIITPGFADE